MLSGTTTQVNYPVVTLSPPECEIVEWEIGSHADLSSINESFKSAYFGRNTSQTGVQIGGLVTDITLRKQLYELNSGNDNFYF